LVTYDYENPDTVQIDPYRCRSEGCNRKFDYRASRNGHEEKKHGGVLEQVAVERIENVVDNDALNQPQDHIHQYQRALLTLNILLRNINDSIREGKISQLELKCTTISNFYISKST
jgi:hypothetical protein